MSLQLFSHIEVKIWIVDKSELKGEQTYCNNVLINSELLICSPILDSVYWTNVGAGAQPREWGELGGGITPPLPDLNKTSLS